MGRAAIVVAMASLIAASAPSAHACSKRHQTVFELFDLAETVAVAKVRWMPAAVNGHGPAGDVDLAVVQLLKGKAGKLVAKETNTSCAAGFTVGRTALVFIGHDGWPVGHYEGYVRDYDKLLPTLEHYAAATTEAERGQVAIDALGDPALAEEAGWWIVDHPDLLARLDATAIERVRVAADTSRWASSQLTAILVRVHQPVADAALAKRGRFAEQRLRDLAALTTFEPVTDPAVLAAAIDSKTNTELDRIAALERCERVRGTRLYWFTRYYGGVAAQFWAALATACRTGTAVD